MPTEVGGPKGLEEGEGGEADFKGTLVDINGLTLSINRLNPSTGGHDTMNCTTVSS